MSRSANARTKVRTLLDEVRAAFADSFTLSDAFLIDAYNRLAASFVLSLPAADRQLTATATDGRLETGLVPAQYRRVFHADTECLRGSVTLCGLLPDFPIYAPKEDGSATVTADGDYTVCYRALPQTATAENADTAELPTGDAALSYLRAALYACAYRQIGDAESAAVCEEDAARALAARHAASEVCI